MTPKEPHAATFNAASPDNWITVATAIAALFIQIAPLLAALFASLNPTPVPPSPAGVTAPDVPAEP